jgi:glycosyltransferase involved in cell wall biosynthesis
LGPARWTSVFADHTVNQLMPSINPEESVYLKEMEGRIAGFRNKMGRFDGSLFSDLQYWLIDDLLVKVDRMTMAHSVEARTPYLDPDLMRAAFSLPEKYKLNRKRGKLILRNSVEKYFPIEISNKLANRKKHGFEVPVSEWLNTVLRERAEEQFSSRKISQSGLFEPNYVRKLWNSFLSTNTPTPIRRKLWLLLRLSSRLVDDGAIVLVVLPHPGPLLNKLQANGVEVVLQYDLAIIERSKINGLPGIIKLVFNIFSSTINIFLLIKKFKPGLVHSNTATILSPGLAAKLCGIPHIWHIRESFGEFGGLWKCYQQYIAVFATKIICVSSPIAEQFELSLRNKLVSVIFNGFPKGEFSPVSGEEVKAFKEKYLLEKALALVGIIGRIKLIRKGQGVFVDAAGILRQKFPDVRFVCIGSPFPGNENHREILLSKIHELGLDDYVYCIGEVEDPKVAIAALDILVLSSAQPEPFAGVIIEGMAMSRPVVATRIGGSIEQVEDGVTGYLVEPGNAQSLATGIEKLLEDPRLRKEFGINSYLRFQKEFEFEQFYSKILFIYENIKSIRS